jgi:3-hydroxy-9,10-secoandrosta-1,3,5(10)-triene-9,17-dione monooxygenase
MATIRSPQATVAVTREELIRRARALAPAVRERVLEAEADRRTPIESIEAFVDAGLARILQPARWGGHELSHDAAFDVAVEIATACGSTGWCASLLNIHDWWLAAFPDAAQHDVWKDGPDVNIAGMVSPTGKAAAVDGGFRLKGLWSYVSGVDHCGWALLAAMVMPSGAGHPHMRFFAVPRRDFAVKDVWHCVGLKGTGSNDVIVEDAFVPEHRTLTMADFLEGSTPGTQVNRGALYRLPMVCIFQSALCAPALGIGRGAHAEWRDWIKPRIVAYTGEQSIDTTEVQTGYARAGAGLDAAEMLMRANLDVVRSGAPIDAATRQRSRIYWAEAVQRICGAVDRLMAMSGTRGFMEASPIQRAWRDVHTIASHVGLNPQQSAIAHGRQQLGLPRDPRLRIY